MSWAVGYDSNWKRDVGYGVPSICDFPDCGEEIDRGLSYVCGGDIFGGDKGCGLYFCDKHLCTGCNGHDDQTCERCCHGEEPFAPTPDTKQWISWKLTDESWEPWRKEFPEKVAELKQAEGPADLLGEKNNGKF